MKKYIGTKIINAKPMTRLEYNKFRGWELPSDENGEDPGFLVEYIDGGKANTEQYSGYVSWSPKDVFEKAYRPISNLTFGMALEALKKGEKVARTGWNGRGMFLWLKSAATVKAEWCKDPLLKSIAEMNGGEVEALGTICMKTADNKVLTGWLASQTDMLSEDWMVVEN